MHSKLAATKHLLRYVKNVLTDRFHEKLFPPSLPETLLIALGD